MAHHHSLLLASFEITVHKSCQICVLYEIVVHACAHTHTHHTLETVTENTHMAIPQKYNPHTHQNDQENIRGKKTVCVCAGAGEGGSLILTCGNVL